MTGIRDDIAVVDPALRGNDLMIDPLDTIIIENANRFDEKLVRVEVVDFDLAVRLPVGQCGIESSTHTLRCANSGVGQGKSVGHCISTCVVPIIAAAVRHLSKRASALRQLGILHAFAVILIRIGLRPGLRNRVNGVRCTALCGQQGQFDLSKMVRNQDGGRIATMPA